MSLSKKKPRGLSLSPATESFFEGNTWVMGVDEVGAGCLAGPLVTAAYAYRIDDFKKVEIPVRIYDSKKLSLLQREKSEEWLKSESPGHCEYCFVSEQEIDEVNIYQARMLGLYRVAKELAAKLIKSEADFSLQSLRLFIDGPVIPKYFLDSPWNLEAHSKGDGKYFSIAAASLLAKCKRDAWMAELGRDYPEYQWASNVGYPTASHKEALKKLGPTEHHRKSFKW